MAAHSKLSPSASKRWMTCTGSVKLIEELTKRGLIEDIPSKFAAEGTAAHELGEKCLRHRREPEDFLGRIIPAQGFKFPVTQEMVDAIDIYVDDVRDDMDGCELQVEVKCVLTSLGIEGLDGGTSDTLLVNPSCKYIIVDDLKYGKGIVVEPEGNTQLMQYALGALIHLGIDEFDDDWDVYLRICQPRAFHPDGPIRSHKMTSGELWEWANEELIPKAQATHNPNAPLVPDHEGCRFCPAMGNCKAIQKKTQEVAHLDFETLSDKNETPTLPDIDTLTADEKRQIMLYGGIINSFIIAVENQMKLEMDHGSKDYKDTHKLVRKTTHRKFTEDALDVDFSDIFDYLNEDDVIEKKPLAMGKIEALLKKAAGKEEAARIMRENTTKPTGDIVIAPLSDKRKPVEASLTSDFNDL